MHCFNSLCIFREIYSVSSVTLNAGYNVIELDKDFINIIKLHDTHTLVLILILWYLALNQ